MSRRKPSNKNRMIESEEEYSDFEAPDLLRTRRISQSDKKIIKSLHSNFLKSGAIEEVEDYDDEYGAFGEQSLEEISEMFDDANAVAKYEKDFHAELYDESLDTYLDELSKVTEEPENEILDGKDDYGNQIFEDTRDRVGQRKKNIPSKVQSGSKVTFTMPNGNTIEGSIIQPLDDF